MYDFSEKTKAYIIIKKMKDREGDNTHSFNVCFSEMKIIINFEFFHLVLI